MGQIGTLLRRWLWVVALSSALGGGLAFALTPQPIVLYEASSTLVISQGSKVTPSINDVFIGQRLALSYVELIGTSQVLEQVITNLDLPATPSELSGQVAASNPKNTNLLVVSVRASDPAQAAVIANEVVRVFAKKTRGLQAERYAAFIQQIEDELAQAQHQLEALMVDHAHNQADLRRREACLASSGAEAEPAGTSPAAQATPPAGQATRAQDGPACSGQDQLAMLEGQRLALEIELEQHRVRFGALLASYEAARLAEVEASDVIMVFEEAGPGRVIVSGTGKGLGALQGAATGVIVGIGIAALAGLRKRGSE